jgi:hypothetical protein
MNITHFAFFQVVLPTAVPPQGGGWAESPFRGRNSFGMIDSESESEGDFSYEPMPESTRVVCARRDGLKEAATQRIDPTDPRTRNHP